MVQPEVALASDVQTREAAFCDLSLALEYLKTEGYNGVAELEEKTPIYDFPNDNKVFGQFQEGAIFVAAAKGVMGPLRQARRTSANTSWIPFYDRRLKDKVRQAGLDHERLSSLGSHAFLTAETVHA